MRLRARLSRRRCSLRLSEYYSLSLVCGLGFVVRMIDLRVLSASMFELVVGGAVVKGHHVLYFLALLLLL